MAFVISLTPSTTSAHPAKPTPNPSTPTPTATSSSSSSSSSALSFIDFTKSLTFPTSLTAHDVASIAAIDACRTIAALSNNCPSDLFFRAAQLIHTMMTTRPAIRESFLQQSATEANRDDLVCLGAAALFAVGKPYTNLNLMRLHKIVKLVSIVIRRRRNWIKNYVPAVQASNLNLQKRQEELNESRAKLNRFAAQGCDDNGNILYPEVIGNLVASHNARQRMLTDSINLFSKAPEQRTKEEIAAISAIEMQNREQARKACFAKEHLPDLSPAEETELNQRIVRWEWVVLEANAFIVIGPSPYPFALSLATLVMDFARAAASNHSSSSSTTSFVDEDLTISVVAHLNDATRSAALCTTFAVEHVAIAAVYCALEKDFPAILQLLNKVAQELDDDKSKKSIPDGLKAKFWWALCCLPEKKFSSSTSTSVSASTSGLKQRKRKLNGSGDMFMSDDDDDGNESDEGGDSSGGDDDDDKRKGSSSTSLLAQQQNPEQVLMKKHYQKVSSKIKKAIENFKVAASLEFSTFDIAEKFDEIIESRKQQEKKSKQNDSESNRHRSSTRHHHHHHSDSSTKDKDNRKSKHDHHHHHHTRDKHEKRRRGRDEDHDSFSD